MRAYKGFEKGGWFGNRLICRDMQYKKRGVNKYKGNISICNAGFHACHELQQVFPFYPNTGENVFYEVECGGEIIESKDFDGKFVCSELEIIRKIDMSGYPIFEDASFSIYGYTIIRRPASPKRSLMDYDGRLVFDREYSFIWPMSRNAIITGDYVRVNDLSYNLVNQEGCDILNTCFDGYDIYDACDFDYMVIRLGDKKKVIAKDSLKPVSDEWFDEVYINYNSCIVGKDKQYNILNNDGTMMFDEWAPCFSACTKTTMELFEKKLKIEE